MHRRGFFIRVFLPAWMADKRPDPNHFYRRCFTARYRAKRSLVKNVWIAAGAIMLCGPTAPMLLIVGLSASLISFIILDETA